MLRNMNGAALKVVGGYDRVIEESELTVVPMGAREIGILIWLGTDWNWAGEMFVWWSRASGCY